MMTRKRLLSFVLTFFFAVIHLGGVAPVYAQQPSIWLDGVELRMPPGETGPVISREGRVLVPARWIAEGMGVEVVWHPDTRQAVFSDPHRRTVLTLDSREAYLNGQMMILDSPAVSINGRTFVPVRFITEAFDAKVDWQAETRRVNITSFQEMAARLKQMIRLEEIGLGDTEEELLTLWGEPREILPSEYGFEWWIYHREYQDYAQVGMENGRIVALYTNSLRWSSDTLLSHKSNRRQVRELLGTPLEWVLRENTRYLRNGNGESDLYLLADLGYVTFFYDLHEGEHITAVKMVLKQTEEGLQGFLGLMTPGMVTSYERQLYLLANAVRVRMGLHPYQWNQQVSTVSRKHSTDMGIRDYFAHESPDGSTPLQRILAEGLRITQVGENIAANLTAIDAHEALMNSPGHRASLLSEMTHMGTGTSLGHQGGTFEIYHTQNFISF